MRKPKPYSAAPVITGAAVIIGAALAGCGQSGASLHPGASASRSLGTNIGVAASPSTPPSGTNGGSNGGVDLGCAPPPAGSVPGKSLALSNADMGRAYCVKVGTAVLIFLRGTPSQRWAPIHVSSTVLAPRANGRLMLMLGETGASYTAVRPGTAIITSYRSACSDAIPPGSGGGSGSVPTGPVGLPPGAPEGGAAASPPTMMCGALIGFRVTVIVR